MAVTHKYAKYDSNVKAAIAMTGIADLFPELSIPRTTADYWIEQGLKTSDPVLAPVVSTLNHFKKDQAQLQVENAELKALLKLVKYCLGIAGSESLKHIESLVAKEKILDAIEIALTHASREACLRELGVSLSTYKRWRRERRSCQVSSSNVCPRIQVNQLTSEEVSVMKNLVQSIEFAHFPIRSLHYYAKREGLLFCCYSTWRKYIDQFGWKRPRKAIIEKKCRVGIRAKSPNEIWHIDVSYFILPNKTKCFIQAVVDNFSRYIVAWQVLDSFDGAKTGALLEAALNLINISKIRGWHLKLVVDGGGENNCRPVEKLEADGHFKKQVARFQISYSNSMIESVFRSLKHNYLHHQLITSIGSLRREVGFWVSEHNSRIPHTAFSGETPLEMFRSTRSADFQTKISAGHQTAKKARKIKNRIVFCGSCELSTIQAPPKARSINQ